MKTAVLGVGLIGGSIGLAARARLDAEVRGFDPDRELLERAVELGAIDTACDSVAAAVEGAELVFCAAPVTALPGLAAEALDAAGDDCAVTDVGSVKRDVIAALGGTAGSSAAPARRSGDLRGGERPRRPLRGRALVPDADRQHRWPAAMTAFSERSRRSARGPRRSRPRRTTA
jgi:hypothetical protein